MGVGVKTGVSSNLLIWGVAKNHSLKGKFLFYAILVFAEVTNCSCFYKDIIENLKLYVLITN